MVTQALDRQMHPVADSNYNLSEQFTGSQNELLPTLLARRWQRYRKVWCGVAEVWKMCKTH